MQVSAYRVRNSVVLVILEAHVPTDQWHTLKLAYSHAMKNRLDGLVSSLLTQDIHERSLWRISTIWESHETAMAHYESGARMPSIYAFHLIGIVPDMTISDIVAHA